MIFWLNDPNVLLKEYKDFFPKKTLSNIAKANAIMRLAIYFAIVLVLFRLDTKWFSVSLLLMLLSLFLGITEGFESINNKCTKPTKDNPYMNFTVGDHINNPNRPVACDINAVRDEQLKYFYKNLNGDIILDRTDLYGKNINDREFYTMPSTTLVNNQNDFANFVFGDFGRCKSEGKDCLKHRDNRFHKGRYYYQY